MAKKLLLSVLFSLVMIFGAFATTATVSTWTELKAAIENSAVDKIIITANIDVDCTPGDTTAAVTTSSSCTDANGAMHISRNIEFEGKKIGDFYPVIKRTGTDSSKILKALFEIYGNGSYDGIVCSFKNITIDGGAVWESSTPKERSESKNLIGTTIFYNKKSPKNTGVCGRSIIDIANKATVNLENNCTIMNGDAATNSRTNSTSTDHEYPGSHHYGGAIRVEWDSSSDGCGGGIINVKSGSKIQDCHAGSGGAIGAYNYSQLNVYGGTISNCSATCYAGAIFSTRRGGTDENTNSRINMYGGLVQNCYATSGGAFRFDAGSSYHYFLGGTVTSCNGNSDSNSIYFYGGNVQNINSTLPNGNYYYWSDEFLVEESPIFSNDTLNSYCSRAGYTNFEKVNTIQIYVKAEDGTLISTLFIEPGESLGDIFPGDLARDDGAMFAGWFTEDGTKVTKDTEFTVSTSIYPKFHKHEWNYVAAGQQLKAYCSNTQNADSCLYQGIDNAIFVTLAANKLNLSAAFNPIGADGGSVKWSSSNTGIAKIDADSGLIKAVANGTTTITVKSFEDGNGKTASATVTVLNN